MKYVERNPVQMITNEKSLVELLRIYGEFIEKPKEGSPMAP